MIILNHILGFPRIGLHRELKKAQEKYWSGNLTSNELILEGSKIRQKNWKTQKKSGIDYIPVGDFAWYDHVLTTTMMLGNIPNRHLINSNSDIDIDCLFRIARGCAPDISASEMTKWFNTNYHYIVPEFYKNTVFKFSWKQILDEVDEALALGYKVKPIILGPITYLWLGKVKGEYFDRLNILQDIIPVYQYLLKQLLNRGIDFVQIDEPALVLELPKKWQDAYYSVYGHLNIGVKLLLTTYFDSIQHNMHFIRHLPVQGIHIDLTCGKYDLINFISKIPQEWMLSLGVINGRNIWRADLIKWFKLIYPILKNSHKDILIGSSCSLLHTPIDLKIESNLDVEVQNWLAFAVQKCQELKLLSDALNTNNIDLIQTWSLPIHNRIFSNKVNNIAVKKRLSNPLNYQYQRADVYHIRSLEQSKKFNFPILPTTTIGSFPQTVDIRKVRSDFKLGLISEQEYHENIKNHIKKVIKIQEELDIDVLVHGESERNDMVEYFGEHLDGFVFTDNGWVQSYGSRCVKPPIIIGDVSRIKPITIKWSKYAQSLTKKPVKGMLTGPVTILLWSFPREDISLKEIATQIAFALRDEVLDLEKEKIEIIQIDEPALREGLPLHKSAWSEYLSWAVKTFQLSSSSVKNTTQIHTHMCYSEFNDIIDSISLLDADVITIETARSDMKLLKSFQKFKYLNEVGPGIYDIHSSNIPSIDLICKLLNAARAYIPFKRLWVNPDCGLKTRNWDEVILSLKNMVKSAKKIRDQIQKN